MGRFTGLWRILIIGALIATSFGCMNRPHSTPAPVLGADEPSGVYRVKPGDTLYSIAWGLELDYLALARWNGLEKPYTIKPGQMLAVRPMPGGSAAATLRRRSENGEITRKIAPQFLDWRVDSWEIPPPRSDLRWVWPAAGTVTEERSGIAIAGFVGAPVRAAEMGRVVYSGDGLKGYGNLVIIKHRHDYLSAYANNRGVRVAEGDEVARGETIAEMGEVRGGARLYFEIRRNTVPENPMRLLPPIG